MKTRSDNIRIDGKYQTRNGEEVRIYAVGGESAQAVHGAYKSTLGGWISTSWYEEGSHPNTPDLQLVPIPPPISISKIRKAAAVVMRHSKPGCSCHDCNLIYDAVTYLEKFDRLYTEIERRATGLSDSRMKAMLLGFLSMAGPR
jgi:hypothetical protein